MKRLFAGIKIEPDDSFIDLIDNIKLELRHENIRWVNTDNYHITLKFFGNTEEDKIEKIEKVFSDISVNYKPFEITVINTGTFERNGKPKILWVGTKENEALNTLANEIDEKLVKLGYSIEKRPFKAHLTIGGIRSLKDRAHFNKLIDNYKNVLIQCLIVDRFILYESILKPGGPLYTEIKDFRFKDF